MVNLKPAALMAVLILGVGFVVGFATARYTEVKCPEIVALESHTEVIRDTVSSKVPAPQYEAAIRVDTARLKIKPAKALKTPDRVNTPREGETLKSELAEVDAEVLVPITRKVYQTPNYRAVVSGFRPSLDSMEVYRDTRITTNTVTKVLPAKKKWLALTVGPSVGVGINGQVVPTVGASLGIIILSK